MAKPKISDDGRTVTVRVPISIRRRGGRKLVLAPDGAEMTAAPVTRHVDNHGQGDRAGLPLARHVGERRVRDNQGDRQRRENQRDLRGSRAAVDVARARHCRGDRQWAEPSGLQLDGLMSRFLVGWRNQRATFLG